MLQIQYQRQFRPRTPGDLATMPGVQKDEVIESLQGKELVSRKAVETGPCVKSRTPTPFQEFSASDSRKIPAVCCLRCPKGRIISLLTQPNRIGYSPIEPMQRKRGFQVGTVSWQFPFKSQVYTLASRTTQQKVYQSSLNSVRFPPEPTRSGVLGNIVQATG
jgi:hypothetical protein